MLVNLYLDDESVIRECAIFPEEVNKGDQNYNSKNEVDTALSKVPWGNKFISYQSKYMQGRIHVNNILSYEYCN